MTNTTKSIYITLAGYIITSLVSFFVVYPAMGIAVVFTQALLIGMILTVVAFVSNLVVLRIISRIEGKERSNYDTI